MKHELSQDNIGSLTHRAVRLPRKLLKAFRFLLRREFGLLSKNNNFWIGIGEDNDNVLEIYSRKETIVFKVKENPTTTDGLSLTEPGDVIKERMTVGYIRIATCREGEAEIHFDGISDSDKRQIAPFVDKIIERMEEEKLFVDAPAENGEGEPRGKRRNRGPSPDVLKDCKKAMEDWLDNDKSLNNAAQLVDRDDQTVLKWIPNVLTLIPSPKREEWIKLIRAQGKQRYLGEFRDV